MPPSAQRRAKTRKQPDLQEHSDVEDLDNTQTPSRKKRRVNNPDTVEATRQTSARDADSFSRRKVRANEIHVFEDDPTFTEDEVNTVINNLKQAKYDIQASIDYSNDVQQAQNPDGKQAYAKIAGKGWTFYVESLEVRIGRPPEERKADTDNGSEPDIHDKSLVHIDLGPSKVVSRQHAEIRYNHNTTQWDLFVNGRNGVRVDLQPIARGQNITLHSGAVIEIADTQMIFITPNESPHIHPKIVDQTRSSMEQDDEDQDNDVNQMQPPALPQETPTRGGATSRSGAQYGQSGNGYRSNAANYGYKHESTQDAHDSRPQSSSVKQKTSPYHRGLMLETTEDIDYSLDSAKDLKPPHSYAQLIGMAIMSSDEEKLTLSKIYEWIKSNYAFYRHSSSGWQNSIRHNLSLNKCFEKVARRTDEPGKGMKWQIVPEHRDEVLKKGIQQTRIKGRSSGPNSPAKDAQSSTDARHDNPSRLGTLKRSPDSTPPMLGYPTAKQAYTPDRGSNYFAHGRTADASSPRPGLDIGFSPFPYSVRTSDKLKGLTDSANAGSPGGPSMMFNSDPDNPLMTPFTARNGPKLMPPSMAGLPSQFIPMSSPAPFWKLAQMYDTPGKPNGLNPNHGLDISPEKKAKRESDISDDVKFKPELDIKHAHISGLRSSSPPLPEGDVGHESPTKAVSMRNGDKAAMHAYHEEQDTLHKIQAGAPHRPPAVEQSQPLQKQPPQPRTAFHPADRQDDDSEEEGGMIDLAKGFQTIGSFHRNISTGVVRGS